MSDCSSVGDLGPLLPPPLNLSLSPCISPWNLPWTHPVISPWILPRSHEAHRSRYEARPSGNARNARNDQTRLWGTSHYAGARGAPPQHDSKRKQPAMFPRCYLRCTGIHTGVRWGLVSHCREKGVLERALLFSTKSGSHFLWIKV